MGKKSSDKDKSALGSAPPVKFAKASNPSSKKKHVAKHVLAAASKRKELEARERTAKKLAGEGDDGDADDDDHDAKTSAEPKKIVKAQHVKPPSEATNYLILWKTSKGDWKFNKNTQSWLLRHAYNDLLVNKKTFGLLLDYADGLAGKLRVEVIESSKKLCLVYKEWEKNATDEEKDVTKDDGDDEADEVKYDGNNFEMLTAKGKRKVYKRSRRIYDKLKEDVKEKDSASEVTEKKEE